MVLVEKRPTQPLPELIPRKSNMDTRPVYDMQERVEQRIKETERTAKEMRVDFLFDEAGSLQGEIHIMNELLKETGADNQVEHDQIRLTLSKLENHLDRVINTIESLTEDTGHESKEQTRSPEEILSEFSDEQVQEHEDLVTEVNDFKDELQLLHDARTILVDDIQKLRSQTDKENEEATEQKIEFLEDEIDRTNDTITRVRRNYKNAKIQLDQARSKLPEDAIDLLEKKPQHKTKIERREAEGADQVLSEETVVERVILEEDIQEALDAINQETTEKLESGEPFFMDFISAQNEKLRNIGERGELPVEKVNALLDEMNEKFVEHYPSTEALMDYLRNNIERKDFQLLKTTLFDKPKFDEFFDGVKEANELIENQTTAIQEAWHYVLGGNISKRLGIIEMKDKDGSNHYYSLKHRRESIINERKAKFEERTKGVKDDDEIEQIKRELDKEYKDIIGSLKKEMNLYNVRNPNAEELICNTEKRDGYMVLVRKIQNYPGDEPKGQMDALWKKVFDERTAVSVGDFTKKEPLRTRVNDVAKRIQAQKKREKKRNKRRLLY